MKHGARAMKDEPNEKDDAAPDGRDPGFMDVQALVTRNRPPSQPDLTPPSSEAARPPKPSAPMIFEAPPDVGPPIELATPRGPRPVRPARRRLSRRAIVLLALAALLVLAGVVFVVLLPVIVRSQVIAAAREIGLELTVDEVSVATKSITLRGVGVRAIRTPGITATVREVQAGTFSSSRDVRILGLDAKLAGERTDVAVGLAGLLADARARYGGGPAGPRHITIAEGRVAWTAPSGDRLAASDIGLEIDSFGPTRDDLKGNVGRFELRSNGVTLGPWTTMIEMTPASSRVRLLFDPELKDGPSALVVSGPGATELTVKIPRSSFDHLGIRPAELGIPADSSTDVELTISGRISDSVRSELTFEGGLWRLRPKGLPGAVDVHVAGTAKASPGKPYDLDHTTLTVGPFGGVVTGTVTPHERGVRLDAMFKLLPAACERLARAEAQKAGPLAATLLALGHSTGALKVTGTVNASGIVHADTAEPGASTLTWLARETCGLSIFGL